jgi:hypothetical protein
MSRSAPLLAALGQRRRRPSARTSVGGAALACVFGVLLLVSTSAGCSTQETTYSPDAALPPCNTGPFIFCKPAPPETPGCNTDEGSSRWLTRLPRATRYPVGCVIDYVGDRDEQGDCKLDAVCKCIVADVSVTHPPTSNDGGSDAGSDRSDAGDASTPSPPDDAGASSQRPMWSCYP